MKLFDKNTQINPKIVGKLKENWEQNFLDLFIGFYIHKEEDGSLLKELLDEPLIVVKKEEKKDKTEDFEWVIKEFIPLFKEVNPAKIGNKKEALRKMISFFEKNRKTTKEDVLKATRYYLSQTNPLYIREARYFIAKNSSSDLEEWIDRYKEYEGMSTSSSDVKDITSEMN